MADTEKMKEALQAYCKGIRDANIINDTDGPLNVCTGCTLYASVSCGSFEDPEAVMYWSDESPQWQPTMTPSEIGDTYKMLLGTIRQFGKQAEATAAPEDDYESMLPDIEVE